MWTCQYPGCLSSEAQIAELRARRPEGFPHDEDPSLQVCTVCRRLPLKITQCGDEQELPLDASFLAGIKEELSSIEESEKNIQSLSQVFRFYARNAGQLGQVLVDFVTKQCFPWELMHALYLLDDILMMDNTGNYKAEMTNKIQAIAMHAFRKVQSVPEKQEVARMLHAWQELKIFDKAILESIRSTLRSGGEEASRILDEGATAEEDDEDKEKHGIGNKSAGQPSEPEQSPSGKKQAGQPRPAATAPRWKRVKVAQTSPSGGVKAADAGASPHSAPAPARANMEKIMAVIDRILSIPIERPFEMLGIPAQGCQGHDIRKAYRRIALLIHPDKNPGFEQKCKDALVKLQSGREQAESDLQALDSGKNKKQDEPTVQAEVIETQDNPNKCRYPGCDLPPSKQCPNRCCARQITHCHMIARTKGGLHCFFHPPPRSWARNAE